MAEFQLSHTAQQQLNEIWDYIAQDNPNAARAVIEAAFSAFRKLAEMPEMGRERDFGNPELQGQRYSTIFEFPNYLIFYFPTGSGIDVSRVLHGARDLEELMEGNPRAE